MFKLEREKTGSTPYILVDEEKSYMYFKGESFHENVMEFYKDIINWLQEYMEKDFSNFTFDCELKYFNSSTAKMLLNMLMLMDNAVNDEKSVKINWITTEDNEIIIECGEDFSDEVSNLDFNLVIL